MYILASRLFVPSITSLSSTYIEVGTPKDVLSKPAADVSFFIKFKEFSGYNYLSGSCQ